MSSVKVGILGHGTIGGGVSRILLSDSDSLQQKSIGKELELTAIATKDPKTDEEFYKSHTHLFREADEILSDPEISIICETIGGNTIALEFVKKALQNGKHVVTANKKMIARHFCELNEIAKKNNVSLLYESAVGGGIPILSTITNGLAGDKTQKTEGILNGTTNFILSEMERTGADFGEVLKAAQNLGYAESDPTDDIEGFDAAYKLCILIALGFNTYISPDAIPTRGISELCASDFDYAAILGKRIKLIATAEKNQNGIFAEVCPMLVSRETRIAKTDGVLNAIHIRGKIQHRREFFERGRCGKIPNRCGDRLGYDDDCKRMFTNRDTTKKYTPFARTKALVVSSIFGKR
jgi:homoserine dehydrogenase